MVQKINSRTDSLLVDLWVFEGDGSPLIGYSVAFLKDGEIKGGRIGDVDGRVRWKISSDWPRQMRISYTGYKPALIDLDAEGQYKIIVHMENSFDTEMPPQTLTYRLVSFNADSLILGSLSDPSTYALYKWDKSSKKKTR